MVPVTTEPLSQEAVTSRDRYSDPRKYSIHRVAVLGAGTMGARIAAHVANAGLPVLLLDMFPLSATVTPSLPKRSKD